MAELPVFVEKPNVGFGTLTTGSTAYQATDANRNAIPNAFKLVFEAGPAGSLLYNARITPLGTNVATVIRLAIYNPSTPTISPVIYEQAFAATTASNTAALATSEVQFNMKLQAGFKLYAWSSVDVSAGYAVCVLGGDF